MDKCTVPQALGRSRRLVERQFEGYNNIQKILQENHSNRQQCARTINTLKRLRQEHLSHYPTQPTTAQPRNDDLVQAYNVARQSNSDETFKIKQDLKNYNIIMSQAEKYFSDQATANAYNEVWVTESENEPRSPLCRHSDKAGSFKRSSTHSDSPSHHSNLQAQDSPESAEHSASCRSNSGCISPTDEASGCLVEGAAKQTDWDNNYQERRRQDLARAFGEIIRGGRTGLFLALADSPRKTKL